jgi:hypothetical protein
LLDFDFEGVNEAAKVTKIQKRMFDKNFASLISLIFA